MTNQEQIQDLINQMLEIAPTAFDKLEDNGTIGQKIKETIKDLENLIKSLGYISHGTKGGRKKWSKDIAVSLMAIFELLPLLTRYKETETFKTIIDKRLSYKIKGKKAVNTNSFTITFGRIVLESSLYYAAKAEDESKCLVVILNTPSLSAFETEEYTKRFIPCKQNVRHTNINKRFDSVVSGLQSGNLVISKTKAQLEWLQDLSK